MALCLGKRDLDEPADGRIVTSAMSGWDSACGMDPFTDQIHHQGDDFNTGEPNVVLPVGRDASGRIDEERPPIHPGDRERLPRNRPAHL